MFSIYIYIASRRKWKTYVVFRHHWDNNHLQHWNFHSHTCRGLTCVSRPELRNTIEYNISFSSITGKLIIFYMYCLIWTSNDRFTTHSFLPTLYDNTLDSCKGQIAMNQPLLFLLFVEIGDVIRNRSTFHDGMRNYSTRNNMHFAPFSHFTQCICPIFIDMVRTDDCWVNST